MPITRLIQITVIGVLSASAAFAQDEHCSVPMADWQPREAVRKMAEAQGWHVGRIKIDDGCYEVFAKDAKGRAFEVAVDPGSLQIIQTEFHDEDEDEGHDHDAGKAEDHD